jgi:hypothetical protein
MPTARQFCSGLIALSTLAEATRMPAGTTTGPSSSASPYVINVPATVDISSLLTVGDSVSDKPGSTIPYRMVGIPDGLGAFDNYDGTFSVLINHEIAPTNGVMRQHGFVGAFVSHWIIRKSDLAVLHGGDHASRCLSGVPRLTASYQPHGRWGRLCSADLPLPSAFYNRKSGKGYSGRIFMAVPSRIS